MAGTIDILANDVAGTNPLDPTSIVLSNVDASLSLVDNGDGTIDVEGTDIGPVTFDYTVDDTLGNTSSLVTVNVTVKPTPVDPSTFGGAVQVLDGDDIVIADAASLTTWPAAVGNNATLVTGTVTVDDDGINGNKCALFGGDGMLNMGDLFGAPFVDCTFFWVGTWSDTGPTAEAWFGNSDTGNRIYSLADSDNVGSHNFFSTAAGTADGPGLNATDANYVFAGRVEQVGADQVVTYYRNLVFQDSETTLATVATTNNNDFALGAEAVAAPAWELFGRIGYFAAVAGALTDVEVLNGIEFLKQKYSIA